MPAVAPPESKASQLWTHPRQAKQGRRDSKFWNHASVSDSAVPGFQSQQSQTERHHDLPTSTNYESLQQAGQSHASGHCIVMMLHACLGEVNSAAPKADKTSRRARMCMLGKCPNTCASGMRPCPDTAYMDAPRDVEGTIMPHTRFIHNLNRGRQSA